MMGSSNDKLNLTGRWIKIDQTPMPITELARAADIKDNAKRHNSAKIDYSVRPRKPRVQPNAPSKPDPADPSL